MHIRIALSLAALALLPSCRAGAASEAPAPAQALPVLLRSYEVAPGTANTLASILNSAVPGQVRASPGGRAIIVVGPAGIQEGVSGLLKTLASEPPLQPEEDRAITITYWLVSGKHAKDAPLPAELTELTPALQSIQKADGPMGFQTQEKLALISGDDQQANQESGGRKTYVEQKAAWHNGKVVARLKIQPDGGREKGQERVETTVQLVPGQILVLAQAGTPSSDGSSLYYLVRADAATKP